MNAKHNHFSLHLLEVSRQPRRPHLRYNGWSGVTIGKIKTKSKAAKAASVLNLYESPNKLSPINLVGSQGGLNQAKKMAKNKCHGCGTKVKERGIQCNICDRWFHPECEEMTENDFQLFRHSSASVHIYCRACEVGSASLHKKMIALMKSHHELEERVNTLQGKVDQLPDKEEIKQIIDETLDDKIEETVDAKMSGLTKKDESQDSSQVCSQVVAELKARETRQMNVIVHGLKESDDPDMEKRHEEDVKELFKMLEEIEAKPPEEGITIKRLGKKEDDKQRPILMTCPNTETKKKIINNAKKLKTSEEYRRIGISHDLTKGQRQELKNLKEQARLKNTENQTFIVIGDPSNWRIVQKKDKTGGET